jgi:hypothetical protein
MRDCAAAALTASRFQDRAETKSGLRHFPVTPHRRHSGARLFPGASPESITTIVDFENHWIHIAPREVRGYGFRACAKRAHPGMTAERPAPSGASRNDDGEACAAEMRRHISTPAFSPVSSIAIVTDRKEEI